MKRFRLSTLMLLIVIAALGIGLLVQQRRAAQREVELQARLAKVQAEQAVIESVLARQQKLLRTQLQKGNATVDNTRKPGDAGEQRQPRE
jgi:hypothetical protein